MGASHVRSSHVLRPSHCPVSRNEQHRKPHAVYSSLHRHKTNYSHANEVVNTPIRGVPVALLLTNSLKLRSSNTSKPKRLGTPSMYLHLISPPPIGAFGKTKTPQIYIFSTTTPNIFTKKISQPCPAHTFHYLVPIFSHAIIVPRHHHQIVTIQLRRRIIQRSKFAFTRFRIRDIIRYLY